MNVSVMVRLSRGVKRYRIAAFTLGKTFTSSPEFFAVSCTKSTVVDSEPKVLAPLRSMMNPGPRIDRKLSCAWLDVWKKLSLYSSDARRVGWNSRVPPRTVVIVGANAPGSDRFGIPVKPGVPGKPGAPRTGTGRGAGIFVCEGAGGSGGVHGGSVVLGGMPGVSGSRPGCWIGYCWSGACCTSGVAGVGVVGWVWPCSWDCPGCCREGSVEGVLGVWARAEPAPPPRRTRERVITRASRAALLPRGPPSPLTSPLEQSLWDKDDVVRLQPDIRILVRRPHHLINIDPNPFLLFCVAAKYVHPPGGGQGSQSTDLGQGLQNCQILRILNRSWGLHLTVHVDRISQRYDDRIARLELGILAQIPPLDETVEVDRDPLVPTEEKALLGVRVRDDASHDGDRLQQRELSRELHHARFAKTSDEVNGPALDLLDHDRDHRALDGLLVDVGEVVLELLHRLAGDADLPDQREGGAAVGPHKHHLVEILVTPDLDLEDVLGTDDVVLVLLDRAWRLRHDRRGREQRYREKQGWQRRQPSRSRHGS